MVLSFLGFASVCLVVFREVSVVDGYSEGNSLIDGSCLSFYLLLLLSKRSFSCLESLYAGGLLPSLNADIAGYFFYSWFIVLVK